MIDNKQAQQRITDLSVQIRKHNTSYYRDASPEVTDEEYDKLFAELTTLERENPNLVTSDSPTQKLSIAPVAGFSKIKHLTRMLSIGNTFAHEGVADFDSRMQKLSGQDSVVYSAEPKFDGLAVSLVYRRGRLFSAATRGDYEEGENVTGNALNISNIPKCIDHMDDLDVRGEVLMTTGSFLALNKHQRALGEKEYANPRNAAAGSLRLLDAAETGRRNLTFVAYSITDATLPADVQTQEQVLLKLRQFAFPVDDNLKLVVGLQGVQSYYDDLVARRHSLPFDIDGVVIKVNDLALQHEAGYISREPRAMIAYKFNQQEAYTVVRAIDVQIGRTGALCPVARLDPVALGGVVVQNATLHNINEIRRLDVRVGDVVLVRRNGDVIPGILSVDKTKRLGREVEFSMPAACPCCGSPVEQDVADYAIIRCTGGINCPEQAVQNLIYFVSRPAMNIDGVGEALCRQLFEAGLVSTPDQFYDLTVDQLLRLSGFKRKSAENAIAAINASRKPELRKFLVALGIRNAGDGTAKRLEAAMGSLSAIRNATIDQLRDIRDIGHVVGSSLYDYFHDEHNMLALDRLVAAMDIQIPKPKTDAVEVVAGKTFVITGTLNGISRDEARAWIESMGGVVSGSVSRKTHFVLAGAEAGSKLDKALELGVKVLSMDDLMLMVGGTNLKVREV